MLTHWPTTNQAPPAAASQAPTDPLMRLELPIMASPPSTVAAAGSTSSSRRPSVHCQVASGVKA